MSDPEAEAMADLARADEWRDIARDMADRGEIALAKQCWQMAYQVEREDTAMSFAALLRALSSPETP